MNGREEEKEYEDKCQAMDICYQIVPDMMTALVEEVLEEEKNKELDEWGFMDMMVDTLVDLADDVQEESNTPCQTPSCSSLPPSRAELKRKMTPEVLEEGLPDNQVYQQYVKDRKNSNTRKKTESVRIITKPLLTFGQAA